MAQSTFQFDCPCCGKRIEFDTRSHRARAVKVTESKVTKDFDTLLADQKGERARLDDVFGSALDAQRKEKDALADSFEKAKKKAKEEPDDKPARPYDLE